MIRNALSFVAVVKAGSFSIAAKNIGVSKAQLSRHVSQLEAALGISLLHRTTRSLSLTESGEHFFQNCLAIEESYNEAVDTLKQDFQAIRGTLRITTTISLGSEFLPGIINQFMQKYPNINVILSLSSITEDLIEQNFDLAIRVANALPDSNLRMRTLMEFETVLCASPAYLKKHKPPTKLAALKEHRCITSINRNLEVKNIQWPFIVNNKIVKYTPNSIVEVDSLRAQIELIALGAGIGRIPIFFIEKELKNGKLVKVLPQVKQPKLYVYLLYPNRKILPKKTQVFIDFIKEKM